jgi:hypothetical protein
MNKKILFIIMIFLFLLTIQFVSNQNNSKETKSIQKKKNINKKNRITEFNYENEYITYANKLNYNKIFDKQKPIQKYQKINGIKYTPKGYTILSLDKNLKRDLISFWNNNKKIKKEEGYIPEINRKNKIGKHNNNTYYLDLNLVDHNLFKRVTKNIKGILSKWIGVNDLSHTSTYGLREYTNNSMLETHIDRGYTHIISAIINVHQDGTWPLIVYDHNNNMEEITMTPEHDLVLYESATIFHGRPLPFKGNSYVNLFIHFKTKDWGIIENKMRKEFLNENN